MKLCKLLSSAISAIFLIAGFSLPVNASSSNYPLGDADLDGTVSASDASLILRYYSEVQTGNISTNLNSLQLKTSDVDKNGISDAVDASMILSIYAANQTAKYITSGNSKYGLYDVPLTWTEAKAFCERLGGHLVSVGSSSEQSLIESLSSLGGKDNYWLGGYYNTTTSSWKWVDGTSFTYTNWDLNTNAAGADQPDNYSGHEYYIRMCKDTVYYPAWSTTAGCWNDTANDADDSLGGDVRLSSFGFICEWD